MPVKKTQKQLQEEKTSKKPAIRFAYMEAPEVAANLQEIEFMPSTLETIDYAFYDFVDKELNLSVLSNDGFKKVPLIWVSQERSFQLKHDKNLRDAQETLILPLITIERKSVAKDPGKRALPYANLYPVNDEKGGTITIARKINQKKTAELDRKSVV